MNVVLEAVKPSTCREVAEAFRSGEIRENATTADRFDIRIENAEVETIGKRVVVIRPIDGMPSESVFLARTAFRTITIS